MDYRDYMNAVHPQPVLRAAGEFKESAVGQMGMHNDAVLRRDVGAMQFVTAIRPLRARKGWIEGGSDIIVLEVRTSEQSLTSARKLYGGETVEVAVRAVDFQGKTSRVIEDFDEYATNLDSSWSSPYQVTVTVSAFMAATGLNEEAKRQVRRRYPNLERQDAKALQEHLMRETLSAVMGGGGGQETRLEEKDAKYKKEVERLHQEWASTYPAFKAARKRLRSAKEKAEAVYSEAMKGHNKRKFAWFRLMQKKYNALQKKYGQEFSYYADVGDYQKAVWKSMPREYRQAHS